MSKTIKVAMADDHEMLRSSLAMAINREEDLEVLFEAQNGKDFVERLSKQTVDPDVAVLDINMPHMDGPETAEWIKAHKPGIRVIALSMLDKDREVIRMVRAGACGYILKGQKIPILINAIRQAHDTGIVSSEIMSKAFLNTTKFTESLALSDRLKEFCRYAATDKTYKEIAGEMNVSHRTVDGYREDLFEKFGVKSRVALVLTSIRLGIVKID